MTLDLREITFYVICREEAVERKAYCKNMLDQFDLQYVFVPALEIGPAWKSRDLTRMKILGYKKEALPLAIIYDDFVFRHPMKYLFELPDDTDAFFLSHTGQDFEEEEITKAIQTNTKTASLYTDQYLRFKNSLFDNCIVYLSEGYRKAAVAAIDQALFQWEAAIPGVLEDASDPSDFLLISPITPLASKKNFGSLQSSINWDSQYAKIKYDISRDLSTVDHLNSFRLYEEDGRENYLFYDLFIHARENKITAIAPYQSSLLAGDIQLTLADLSIEAKLMECGDNIYEKYFRIDFEDPVLDLVISSQKKLNLSIRFKELEKNFELEKSRITYDSSLSVLIEDEVLDWLIFYLDYYLNHLKVDHIYLYDLGIQQGEALNKLILPYLKRGQISIIYWPFPHLKDHPQFHSQGPLQKAHHGHKYGANKYVAAIKVNQFLSLPSGDFNSYLDSKWKMGIKELKIPIYSFFYKGRAASTSLKKDPLTHIIYKKEEPIGFTTITAGKAHAHQVDMTSIEDAYCQQYPLTQTRVDRERGAFGKIDRRLANFLTSKGLLQKMEEDIDYCLLQARLEYPKLLSNFRERRHENGIHADLFFKHLTKLPYLKLLVAGKVESQTVETFLACPTLEASFILQQQIEIDPKRLLINRTDPDQKVLKIIHETWKEVDPLLLDKFTCVFFDTHRDEESLNAFWEQFLKNMHRAFIWLSTNWNEENYREFIFRNLEDNGLQISFKRELISDHVLNPLWKNGLGILGLKKV